MAGEKDLDIGRLLHEGVFSDLTITCHGREFKVHKSVLYASCDYFCTLLSGPFKESNAGMIDFPDDDPDDLHRLLFYIYNSDFLAQGGDDMSVLMCYARLYAIADKYNIQFVREGIIKFWREDNTLDEIFDADLVLQEEAKDVEKYVELVRFVDASTCDNTLLDLMLSCIRERLSSLILHESFKLLLSELPDLHVTLLTQLAPLEPLRKRKRSVGKWAGVRCG